MHKHYLAASVGPLSEAVNPDCLLQGTIAAPASHRGFFSLKLKDLHSSGAPHQDPILGTLGVRQECTPDFTILVHQGLGS